MEKMQFLRPDSAKQLILLKKTSSASVSAVLGRCEIFRFFTESWGKSSLGARLRTRKVTGRDASLPAPLLAASLGLVGRGTVGALPQTPQGTLSLDPARGRRKGTKSPLDPSARLSWSRFHAPSACSFLALRLILFPNSPAPSACAFSALSSGRSI